MGSSFRIRGLEFRSDSLLRVRLDWRQREIVKRGSYARGTTSFESVYKKTEDNRQKQCRSRTVCSSIGSVRSEGDPKHDV